MARRHFKSWRDARRCALRTSVFQHTPYLVSFALSRGGVSGCGTRAMGWRWRVGGGGACSMFDVARGAGFDIGELELEC